MGKTKKEDVEKPGRRQIKDGFVQYWSDSLDVSNILNHLTHIFAWQHKKEEVKGELYKMAKEVKFFSLSLYYKRYFILNPKQGALMI